MIRSRLAWASWLVMLMVIAAPAGARDKTPAPSPYIDDDEMLSTLTARLGEFANDGKCLKTADIKKKVSKNRTCTVAMATPSDKRLDPEDVHEQAQASVFVLGSVVKGKDDEGKEVYIDGRMATAWVVAADGILVTNWHVFDQLDDNEVFGVMNRAGQVYPVTDIIGVNQTADIAIFRVAAKGLTPLAVAERPARVGSWVGVLGHPGDRYYTFTQGHVTRYAKSKKEDGTPERWMSITADYAYGSSGSPILDRRGAVVGMAAMTENIDYPMEGEPAPAEGKKDAPPRKDTLLQMVVKLTTPVADLRAVMEKSKD